MIFSVVIFAMIGGMWVLDVIDSQQALDFSSKSIALVVITGAMLFAIAKVATSKEKSPPSETANKPGPKF